MRIFVDGLAAGELSITGDEHHYLGRVRRARPGDQLELYDGAGRRVRAVIARITATETIVTAGEPELVVEPPPRIRVIIPPIKGDRMDSCIEKLVEVGADDIVVWPAARAVVKLAADRVDARLAHYRSIAQAAARQSIRATVPTVAYSEDLAGAVSALPDGDRIVLDPATDMPLGKVAASYVSITLISGPEGGLAADELESLVDRYAFVPSSLGPRVLRAETAPVIAVAILRHLRFTQ